jgi:hypothetical protein
LKEGCREIVSQILAGAEEYWLTSFSEERKFQTRSKLDSLIQKLDISGIHCIVEAFERLSREDLRVAPKIKTHY